MSLFDKLKQKAEEMGLKEKAEALAEEAKKAAEQAKEKVGDLAAENKDRVEGLVDKASAKIDEKTEGKYSDKLDKAKEAVSKGVDKLAEGGSGAAGAAGAAAAAGTAGAAGADGVGSILADEEAVAEASRPPVVDPEAPLDPPLGEGRGVDDITEQRSFDENGEPLDETPNDPDAPELP